MIGAVKKALLLCLLIFLPLQFVWVAAAPYCGHEPELDAGHFGHHQHQHAAASAGVDGAEAPAKAQADIKAAVAADADCGYCHLSCQASFLMALPQVPELPASTMGPSLLSFFSSRLPDRLLRPDWRLAA